MKQLIVLCNLFFLALNAQTEQLIKEIKSQDIQEAVDRNEVVVKTVDGHYYSCAPSVVEVFGTIKALIEDCGKQQEITIPNMDKEDFIRVADIINKFSQSLIDENTIDQSLVQYLKHMKKKSLAKLLIDINYLDFTMLYSTVENILAEKIAVSKTLFPLQFGKKTLSGALNYTVADTVRKKGNASKWQLMTEINDQKIEYYNLTSTAQSKDGKTLALGYIDGFIHIWQDQEVSKQIKFSSASIEQLTFSPCGRWLAARSSMPSDELIIYSTTDYEIARTINMEHSINSFAFSPDGQQIAIADDFKVRILNASTGKKEKNFKTPSAINSIAFSPKGNRLAVGLDDGVVRIIRLDGDNHISFGFDGPGVNAVSFSSDGTKIAVGYEKGMVRIIDEEGKIIRSFDRGNDHNEAILAIAFSNDAEIVAASSFDRIIFWHANSGIQINNLEVAEVYSISFSQHEEAFVTNQFRCFKPRLSNLHIQEVQVLGWKLNNVKLDENTKKEADKIYEKMSLTLSKGFMNSDEWSAKRKLSHNMLDHQPQQSSFNSDTPTKKSRFETFKSN